MSHGYRLPPFTEVPLNNGCSVVCLPDSEQDGLVIALQIPVGRFSDPIGKEGVCELTAGLLSKGTRSFSPEEFSEKLENVGASLFSEIGEEHCILGMRMRATTVRELLPVFIEMITRPALPKGEFIRLRREMITSLQAEAVEPSFVAARHFYAELCGNGHPAGRFQTVNSLRNITIADAERFFNRYFLPEGSWCVVAGNLEPDFLRRLAVEQFSFWKGPGRTAAAIAPPVAHPRETIVRLIHKPDLTQATLLVGHAGPGENFARKQELQLANYIFGSGNFSSRLMTRIRSAYGKTYGVSSQLVAETEFGAFQISTSTQTAQAGEVVKTIIEELHRLYSDGVTGAELVKAQRFATGNMAFQLEGISNIAEKILWLRFYKKPDSYIEQFEEIIGAVTVERINAAVREKFSPGPLVITAVGNKKELLPQLSAFGPVKQFHFRDKV